MNELVKEMEKYKVDKCDLQQKTMARERNCDKKEFYDFM
jgi:hypothetical protein